MAMIGPAYVARMAGYNAWMNQRVYAAAGRLTPAEQAADRNAFFGSILGTLNHLAVADTLWMQRFAGHPRASGRAAGGPWAVLAPVRRLATPAALDQVLFGTLEPLWAYRRQLDAWLLDWAGGLEPADLEGTLAFSSLTGGPQVRAFDALLMHFFNHQAHHRGQLTTLLTQAGEDVGVTDLPAFIPAAA
jgi:uncharacterized damage-inducible protein DinB